MDCYVELLKAGLLAYVQIRSIVVVVEEARWALGR